jgi:hypothetical protein
MNLADILGLAVRREGRKRYGGVTRSSAGLGSRNTIDLSHRRGSRCTKRRTASGIPLTPDRSRKCCAEFNHGLMHGIGVW